MKFRSIGFLPVIMTLVMGALFILKFQRESAETEYAMNLTILIDESSYDDGTTSWDTRQKNFFLALNLISEARDNNVDVDRLVNKATEGLEAPAAYQRVLADSLQLNLRIADELQLLTDENLVRLEAGEHLQVTAGGFAGEDVILGNTIPHQYSPELETLYANLLLKPEREARRFPRRIGDSAEVVLSACRSAEIMTELSYERTKRAMERAGRS